jgi:deoxyribodipyrimidine photo-lyase
MTAPQIVWLRRDLRLSDQPALHAAAKAGPVIAVYVLDDETPKHRKMGGASRWWLRHSLAALDADLRKIGSRLILRRGEAAQVIADLARETGAAAVHALRHYEPWWRNAERDLKERLPDGVPFHRYDGLYLTRPGTITSGSGGQYKIYTPYWRALAQQMPPPEPLPAPAHLAAPDQWPTSDELEDWALLPTRPDWAGGMRDMWPPAQIGEAGAMARLNAFAPLADRYPDGRNLPSKPLTSYLSPYLHFGEISVGQIWHHLTTGGAFPETYLKELVWRDYAANVTLQLPDYGRRNAKAQFDAFPWRDPSDPIVAAELAAWQQGRTGYPIVDAGMRQLWATGWMHNRVRMIAASFLIKHLLIDWRIGEQWFWDTLVDADYASNAVNWQWSAGTGVDANMFVRIMAPLTQSEKFDAGAYIRQWVPELANLSDPYIHDPDAHGCRPRDYPRKIVAHKAARERALAAFAEVKGDG